MNVQLCDSSRPASGTRRGFTIVELIISIAILFTIITTAFVALHYARAGAERTVSLNALRQMMVAYTAYSHEHDNRLLPGYVDPAAIGDNDAATTFLVPRARLRTGYKLTPEDSASWVWRLAPYLDHDWHTFMADYRDEALLSKLDQQFGDGDSSGTYGPGSAGSGALNIAEHPSFGLNSIFVGGDMKHGDPDRAPWTLGGPAGWQKNPMPDEIVAATRASEVKNPARLIVFGGSVSTAIPTGVPSGAQAGYMELRAPWADLNGSTPDDLQWRIETVDPLKGHLVQEFTGPGGLPFDRVGGDKYEAGSINPGADYKVPVGYLDGSTGSYDPNEVAEPDGPSANARTRMMSRWSPFAVSWR